MAVTFTLHFCCYHVTSVFSQMQVCKGVISCKLFFRVAKDFFGGHIEPQMGQRNRKSNIKNQESWCTDWLLWSFVICDSQRIKGDLIIFDCFDSKIRAKEIAPQINLATSHVHWTKNKNYPCLETHARAGTCAKCFRRV